MIFKNLGILDVFLIRPKLFEDNRGSFRRSFCINEFKENGLVFNTLQGNISENPKLGTLRGFHYQLEPSPTFLKTISIKIDSHNKNSLFIPKGCANAWLTTKKNTIIHYYMSEIYESGHDKGIRYNDSFFNIKWPFEPKIISEKDQSYPDYRLKKIKD